MKNNLFWLFIVGTMMIAFSFLSFLIPQEDFSTFNSLFLFNLFALGLIIISEIITLKYAKFSLFHKIVSSKRNLVSFIMVSAVCGLFLDLIANIFSKLWIYPYWDLQFYLLVFIPGFAIYWLVICESYLATKCLIDLFSKGKKYVTKPFKNEKKLFDTLGIFGIIFLILGVVITCIDYFNNRTTLFGVEDLTSVTNNYVPPFYIVIILFFGIWFILEYIQHHEKKTSLIKDIIHNYKSPLLAILICCFVLGTVMELQNVPIQFWIYTNWPFQEITFLGFPLIVIFIWPLHCIPFLSLFRAVSDKASADIWSGDLIK